MKIEGPGRTNAPGKTDAAKKTGGASGATFSEFLTGADSVENAAPAAPVAGVNMYVALQAAEHATEERQRRQLVERAGDLLDDLEDLRLGLIFGSYTKKQLYNLAARLQQQRVSVKDPALLALLDEIELRAAVELAKYQD